MVSQKVLGLWKRPISFQVGLAVFWVQVRECDARPKVTTQSVAPGELLYHFLIRSQTFVDCTFPFFSA